MTVRELCDALEGYPEDVEVFVVHEGNYIRVGPRVWPKTADGGLPRILGMDGEPAVVFSV